MKPKAIKELFRSLIQLAKQNGLQPKDVQGVPYPLNILQARHHLQFGLMEKGLAELLLIERGCETFAATREQVDTQSTLYYIPVKPLHDWLQLPERQGASALLVCTFAYLYNMALIPFYADADSYIGCEYEMLKEWSLDSMDCEPDEQNVQACREQLEELETAAQMGDDIAIRISDPSQLETFGQKVAAFFPADALEEECLAIACITLALFNQYPSENLFSHVHQNPLSEEDNTSPYDDECITVEKYVHFVATSDGRLSQMLEETVNNELGEYADTEQPVCLNCFDANLSAMENLDYERKLFSLLTRLCTFLNHLP